MGVSEKKQGWARKRKLSQHTNDSTEDRIGWAGTKITDGKTCWLYMAIRLSK